MKKVISVVMVFSLLPLLLRCGAEPEMNIQSTQIDSQVEFSLLKDQIDISFE